MISIRPRAICTLRLTEKIYI